MAEITVIVPAFNAAHTLSETLEAIAAQDFEDPYEIIVVDDGSADGTAEIVERAGAPFRLIKQAQQGPAAARNRGAAEATAGVFAFTDADCVPQPGWLRKGTAALAGVDLVQGRVVPDPRADPQPFDRTLTVSREYGLYETANLLVTRRLFEEMGGFQDWLPARVGKPLAEDVWFGWKARRWGARTRFAPDAVVHHAVFRRSASEFVAERLRLVYFPAMVAKMPELREHFLYRRWFLTRRSARFDLAVAGLVGAWFARRSRLPAAGALMASSAIPYTRLLSEDARRWGRRAPHAIVAGVAADVVGLAALAWGSLARRTPVL